MGLTHDYDHQVTYAPEKNEHPSIRTEQLSTFATATELSLIAEAMEEIKSKGDTDGGDYYAYLVADVSIDLDNESYEIEYTREDTGL
jgi:hypothetical protein